MVFFGLKIKQRRNKIIVKNNNYYVSLISPLAYIDRYLQITSNKKLFGNDGQNLK